MATLIRLTEDGLYCEAGGFYVDPWRAVDRAIITHAHADHARWGCKHYLGTREGRFVLRDRLGLDATIQTIPYGEPLLMNGVRVSLHPAGHILGSAQVRIEYRGEVWVISGDYKLDPDPTCAPFEVLRCDTFVTESTFGLPVYRWPPQREVFAGVNAWWRANQQAGKASLLLGYSLGKAQRLMTGIDPTIGPIFTHGAVEKVNRAYRESGVDLPTTNYVGTALETDWSQALIIAPPSAHGSAWTRRFGTLSTGFASGWMRVRGARRRQSVDRGFILSDHVDWPGLLLAIRETGAQRVWVTHGFASVVVRWLQEQGLDAWAIPTQYEGEQDDPAEVVDA